MDTPLFIIFIIVVALVFVIGGLMYFIEGLFREGDE